ncbi:hypothetical protein HNR46_003441 [Haloferula luteola]|uniref:Uncharacterized protein n=1 Tax=Haloferula luteola TaxID=595692 RepID=A0A840V4H9_9BACT|nr:hypothetical protein [Haloferula luteola]MBB5353187.1 hypothetical protein [Haloferula luteola]
MTRLLFALLFVGGVARALDVRFLAWDDQVAAREVVASSGKSGGKSIADLHPLKRTEAVSVTPVEGQLLLRTPDRTVEDDKPAEMSVALPEAFHRPLVILLPDPKSPTGLRGFALNDSPEGFTWGTFRMVNATPKPLNLIFGKKRLRLPTGWKPVDVDPDGETSLPVGLALSEDPSTPLYTSRWSASPDIRRLVFIMPGTDPRLGPLAMKIIPEDRRLVVSE